MDVITWYFVTNYTVDLRRLMTQDTPSIYSNNVDHTTIIRLSQHYWQSGDVDVPRNLYRVVPTV